MSKQVINNLESANTIRTKLNSNFTELYDGKANTNHSAGDTTYGAASTTLFGHIKVTQANGLAITGGVLSMAAASTSASGGVQLVNNLTTNDSTKALTAAMGKQLYDTAVVTYSGTTVPLDTLGKDGDLYLKTA